MAHRDLRLKDRLGGGVEVVARSPGHRHGNFGRFDLALLFAPDVGRWYVECFMKIQFDFDDGSALPISRWTDMSRNAFMKGFATTVQRFWDTGDAGPLKSFGPLSVAFVFDIRSGLSLSEHFYIRVNAVALTDHRSAIGNLLLPYDGRFVRGDLQPKPSGRITAVHEFGHMLGLGDEYESGDLHFADKTSMMNRGTEVRPRHLRHLLEWANAQLVYPPNAFDPFEPFGPSWDGIKRMGRPTSF